jgi:hypothetical protein
MLKAWAVVGVLGSGVSGTEGPRAGGAYARTSSGTSP